MYSFLLLISFLNIIIAHANITHPWESNIIGGYPVDITKYPYQARLEGSKGLMCGASILTQHHVLCAYNCILFVKEPLTVHTGTSLLSDTGSVHRVDANFTVGWRNDANIAVLRVVEPIIFDKYRQPIKLYTSKEDPKPGQMAIVTGWGFANNKHLSNQLRFTEVPIISRTQCKKLYRKTVLNDITRDLICAGFTRKGGKDTCKGDAGGPLVINGRQAGITSKGMGCANKKYPGIYTNVAYYSDWITQQILK